MAFGYELCFNGNVAGIFGRVQHIFLSGSDLTKVVLKEQGITAASYLLFEMMFAIIIPALFVGATVGRMRSNFLLVFVFFWSGGRFAGGGILDFAGGWCVNIKAGITALVLSIFLGPRYQKQTRPYSLPWVLLGDSHPLARLVRL